MIKKIQLISRLFAVASCLGCEPYLNESQEVCPDYTETIYYDGGQSMHGDMSVAPSVYYYPTMQFEKVEEVPLSLAINTGNRSFYEVRSQLELGERPVGSLVHLPELVNYFHGKSPAGTEALQVSYEVSSPPWSQNSRLVRVHIQNGPLFATDLKIHLNLDEIWIDQYRLLTHSYWNSENEYLKIPESSNSLKPYQSASFWVELSPHYGQVATFVAPLVASAQVTYSLGEGEKNQRSIGVDVVDSGLELEQMSQEFQFYSGVLWFGLTLIDSNTYDWDLVYHLPEFIKSLLGPESPDRWHQLVPLIDSYKKHLEWEGEYRILEHRIPGC